MHELERGHENKQERTVRVYKMEQHITMLDFYYTVFYLTWTLTKN